MKINSPLREGLFLQRKSVDIIEADVEGLKLNLLCPNSSKLEHTAVLGSRIWYTPEKFSPCYKPPVWQFLELDYGKLVCVNSDLCLDLFEEGVKSNSVSINGNNFEQIELNRDASLPGGFRYDFNLKNHQNNKNNYVVVKTSTEYIFDELVGEEYNIFPEKSFMDNKDELYSLIHAKMLGHDATICCFVLHSDIKSLLISEEYDYEYARLLIQALSLGVKFYAYNTKVELGNIEVDKKINLKFV